MVLFLEDWWNKDFSLIIGCQFVQGKCFYTVLAFLSVLLYFPSVTLSTSTVYFFLNNGSINRALTHVLFFIIGFHSSLLLFSLFNSVLVVHCTYAILFICFSQVQACHIYTPHHSTTRVDRYCQQCSQTSIVLHCVCRKIWLRARFSAGCTDCTVR